MIRLQHHRRNTVVALLEISGVRTGDRNGLKTYRLIPAAGHCDRLGRARPPGGGVGKGQAQCAWRKHRSHRALSTRWAHRRHHRQNLRGLLEKRLADRSGLAWKPGSRIHLIHADSENPVCRARRISKRRLRVLQSAQEICTGDGHRRRRQHQKRAGIQQLEAVGAIRCARQRHPNVSHLASGIEKNRARKHLIDTRGTLFVPQVLGSEVRQREICRADLVNRKRCAARAISERQEVSPCADAKAQPAAADHRSGARVQRGHSGYRVECDEVQHRIRKLCRRRRELVYQNGDAVAVGICRRAAVHPFTFERQPLAAHRHQRGRGRVHVKSIQRQRAGRRRGQQVGLQQVDKLSRTLGNHQHSELACRSLIGRRRNFGKRARASIQRVHRDPVGAVAVEKTSLGIDKAADQPRRGHAIHSRPWPRNPQAPAIVFALDLPQVRRIRGGLTVVLQLV